MVPLLVALLCLTASAAPLEVTLATAYGCDDGATQWNDAQCDKCPCWLPAPGCSVVRGCAKACGYLDAPQWGPFGTSDASGCVDMDLLTPPAGWVYMIRERAE